jgi:hypothetical protein
MVPASRFPLLLICPSWFSQGYTALHIAASTGNLAIAKLLLQRGADPSLKTFEGGNVIDGARANGHSEIVALLRAMSDPMGKAVWQAAKDGNEAELRRRIEDGASVNWHNPNPGVRRRMCLACAPASSPTVCFGCGPHMPAARRAWRRWLIRRPADTLTLAHASSTLGSPIFA